MENNNANQNKVVRLMIDTVSRGNEEAGWGWVEALFGRTWKKLMRSLSSPQIQQRCPSRIRTIFLVVSVTFQKLVDHWLGVAPAPNDSVLIGRDQDNESRTACLSKGLGDRTIGAKACRETRRPRALVDVVRQNNRCK